MIYLITRAIVFFSVTLGGSFAFLALTTPGNSEPAYRLSYDTLEYHLREAQLEGHLSEVEQTFPPFFR